MRTYIVRNKILLEPKLLINFCIFSGKLFVHFVRAFPHKAEHAVAYVFGRNFKLAGNVMFAQFAEKCSVFVHHQVIKPDAASDKNFLYSWPRAAFAQKLNVLAVVNFHVRARVCPHAVSVRASSALRLKLACVVAEVCSRSANVVDISLELRVVRHLFCFAEQAFVASRLYAPSLMECDCAEAARAKTSAAACERELNFLKSRNSSLAVLCFCVIAWMPAARKRQLVQRVKFLSRKRKRCFFLNNKARVCRFYEHVSVDCVSVLFLRKIRARKKYFAFISVFADIRKRGKHKRNIIRHACTGDRRGMKPRVRCAGVR